MQEPPRCTMRLCPSSSKFGDAKTADHKVLSKESEFRMQHRCAVVVQYLCSTGSKVTNEKQNCATGDFKFAMVRDQKPFVFIQIIFWNQRKSSVTWAAQALVTDLVTPMHALNLLFTRQCEQKNQQLMLRCCHSSNNWLRWCRPCRGSVFSSGPTSRLVTFLCCRWWVSLWKCQVLRRCSTTLMPPSHSLSSRSLMSPVPQVAEDQICQRTVELVLVPQVVILQ